MTDLLSLTPVQQRVADELLGLGAERPVADLSWARDLSDWIDDELPEHAPHVGRKQRWVSKGSMSGMLGCEAHHLATKDDFTWSIETAKGTVVHHAFALAAAGSDAAPVTSPTPPSTRRAQAAVVPWAHGLGTCPSMSGLRWSGRLSWASTASSRRSPP